MKNRYLGVIVFPVVAISIATVVVNWIGVLMSGGAERGEPTVTKHIISLFIGLTIMLTLYSIPAFKRWVPSKKNLGIQIEDPRLEGLTWKESTAKKQPFRKLRVRLKKEWVVIVAVICASVAGHTVYTYVVNETFHWTTSPTWLDGKQVARGMAFVVLIARWVFRMQVICSEENDIDFLHFLD